MVALCKLFSCFKKPSGRNFQPLILYMQQKCQQISDHLCFCEWLFRKLVRSRNFQLPVILLFVVFRIKTQTWERKKKASVQFLIDRLANLIKKSKWKYIDGLSYMWVWHACNHEDSRLCKARVSTIRHGTTRSCERS